MMRILKISKLNRGICKRPFAAVSAAVLLIVAACTVNPATGEKQFTAFLPASQEESMGASEHENVRKTYGDFITGPVADYVSGIGAKVSAGTERADVQYKFFVVDSPIVNAFAVPGGYIYVTRGLIALANNEAELAGVMAHEVGHITARHTAARVSQGMLASLGAAVLSAATGSNVLGQVASTGSDLYIKSYSRGQEDEADGLGVRYLAQAGYDPKAMASFLASLDAQTKLDQKIAGQSEGAGANYFSTHPVTSERVAHAKSLAAGYPAGQGVTNRDSLMRVVNGLAYGDSESQGFVRGNTFYHPKIGFAFTVPDGFQVQNGASELVAVHASGAALIFDTGSDSQNRDPSSYLTQVWMKDAQGVDAAGGVESMSVGGMRAATAAFAGTANGQPVTVRVVAIEWQPGQFFRFQMAIPQKASTAVVEGLKKTTYSFRRMTDSERASIKPLKVRTFVASGSDSAALAAQRMQFPDYREERFRVLNGLTAGQALTPGQTYKVIAE